MLRSGAAGGRAELGPPPPPWAARPPLLAQPRAADPRTKRRLRPKPPPPLAALTPASAPGLPSPRPGNQALGKAADFLARALAPPPPRTPLPPLAPSTSGPNVGGSGLEGGIAGGLEGVRGAPSVGVGFAGVVWGLRGTALPVGMQSQVFTPPLKIRGTLAQGMRSPVRIWLVGLAGGGTPEAPPHPLVAGEFLPTCLRGWGDPAL